MSQFANTTSHDSHSSQDKFIELGTHWSGGILRIIFCFLFMIALFFGGTIGAFLLLAEFWHPAYLSLITPDISSMLPWQHGTPSRAMFDHGYNLAAVGFAVIAVCLSVHIFHKVPIRSLFTSKDRIQWGGFASSFLWLFGIYLVDLAFWYLIKPREFILILEWEPFLIFLGITAVFLPFQVLGEEVFYRGYLMQLCRKITDKKILIVLVPTSLFAWTHFWNPSDSFDDIWAKAFYVVFGLYWAILALKTNGIEYSVGAHLANNVFAFVIVSSNYQAPSSPTIFFTWAEDNIITLIDLIVLFSLHYFCVFKLPGLWRRFRSRNLPDYVAGNSK